MEISEFKRRKPQFLNWPFSSSGSGTSISVRFCRNGLMIQTHFFFSFISHILAWEGSDGAGWSKVTSLMCLVVEVMSVGVTG